MSKKIGVSYFRKRIMEDDKVKYIYSTKSEVIHDKSCAKAANIPDENLIYLEDYHSEMSQCSHCTVKAYIRMGAADFENYGMYEKLFVRMHADAQNLRHMYVDCGMKTKVFGNYLLIRDREDVWKIDSLDSRGNVQLLHNNYHIQKNGDRKFVHGFHVQNDYCSHTSLQNAVRTIETYSYDKHKASVMAKQVEIKEKALVPPVDVFVEKRGFSERLRKIKEWFEAKRDKITSESKNNFNVEITDFNVVERAGYPKNGDRCIYIWEDKNGEKRWQTGVYDKRKGCFIISFKEVNYITVDKKVLAWKRLDNGVLSVEGK